MAGGGLALIYQDTTDAHAVETALRASEQRNALIARAAAEGIYDWDVIKAISSSRHGSRDPRLRRSSAPAEEWYARLHPDDLDRYGSALRAHFKGETSRFECEYRMRRRGGP